MKKKHVIILISVLVVIVLFLSSFLLYLNSFQLKGKYEIELNFGDSYREEGYQANFLFLSLASFVKVDNMIDYDKIGTYEITYHLPFKTLKRKVIVKDTTGPVIVLNGEELVQIPYGKTYVEEGYQATDNYDGDITSKVVVDSNIDYTKIGTYEINYQVNDSSENSITTKRVIEIKDTEKPTLTLKGDSTYYLKLGNTYKDPGYNAKDNYDGDLNKNVKVTSNVNNKKVGTYTVIYEVEDSSKNKTTKKRTVIVEGQQIVVKNGITYINGILLVNKTYHLPSTYNPGVNATASKALSSLQAAAKKSGYSMPLLSGFRSYSYQKNLYNNYVKIDGEAKANTYSAKPGQSEHQTGLAFDVGEISDNYGNTNAGKWLASHAHEYGFIIRYQKGKESITGYKYEPWHIRYVGVEIATDIYKKGVTLEEYLGVAK